MQYMQERKLQLPQSLIYANTGESLYAFNYNMDAQNIEDIEEKQKYIISF